MKSRKSFYLQTTISGARSVRQYLPATDESPTGGGGRHARKQQFAVAARRDGPPEKTGHAYCPPWQRSIIDPGDFLRSSSELVTRRSRLEYNISVQCSRIRRNHHITGFISNNDV